MASHPKFNIEKAKNGKFKWNLTAKNGEVVLTSQMYQSKASCKNGISSVKKNCKDKSRYEILKAKNGKRYFNLKARNGLNIGTSQMYASTSGCNNGCKSVSENAKGAKIEDNS